MSDKKYEKALEVINDEIRRYGELKKEAFEQEKSCRNEILKRSYAAKVTMCYQIMMALMEVRNDIENEVNEC